MTDLPSDIQKMQVEETDFESPNSESLFQKFGSNINGLIDRITQGGVEFLTSGNYTVPEETTQLLLIGCGGGGGGVNFTGTGDNVAGSGAPLGFKVVSVTPLDVISVTIGAGGSGGPAPFGPGSGGGTTSFGSLANFYGGTRGNREDGAIFGEGSVGVPRTAQAGQRGGGTFIYDRNGGVQVTTNFGPQRSAFFNANSDDERAGGNGPFGAGGVGGTGSAAGGSAAANTGGGGGSTASISQSAGNGGSGRLFILPL